MTTCPCNEEQLVQFVLPKRFQNTVAKYNCVACGSRIMVIFTYAGTEGQVKQNLQIMHASDGLREILAERKREWMESQKAKPNGESVSVPG